MLMRYVLRYTSEWYKHQATEDKEKKEGIYTLPPETWKEYI